MNQLTAKELIAVNALVELAPCAFVFCTEACCGLSVYEQFLQIASGEASKLPKRKCRVNSAYTWAR